MADYDYEGLFNRAHQKEGHYRAALESVAEGEDHDQPPVLLGEYMRMRKLGLANFRPEFVAKAALDCADELPFHNDEDD